MRIGILLTRLHAEKKKDELVRINSKKRPWLKETPRKFTIRRGKHLWTSGDVSVGMYLMWNWKNVVIDFIRPEDISEARLKKNDLNFMLIYDLLESYHVDKRPVFLRMQKTLARCGNVYPPFRYQKFINNKCSYISHLKRKRDSIIPTFCIASKIANKRGMKWCLNAVEHAAKKWGNLFIGKPIYGQESSYFKKFEEFNKRQLEKYMRIGFKKYPGLIFQKYIPGFDKNKQEIRVYFIGDKYRYSVITAGDKVSFPKTEGGYTKLPGHKKLIRKARKTMKNLPPLIVKGKRVPRLLTRIDIATENGGLPPYIVSEVEFVPSLYIEDVTTIPEPLLGDQIIKIMKKLKKKR